MPFQYHRIAHIQAFWIKMSCVLVSLWPHQVEINTSPWHMCSLLLSFYQYCFFLIMKILNSYGSRWWIRRICKWECLVIISRKTSAWFVTQSNANRSLRFWLKEAVNFRIFQICVFEDFYSSETNQLRKKYVVCRWFVLVVLFSVLCKTVSDTKLLLLLFSLSRWLFFLIPFQMQPYSSPKIIEYENATVSHWNETWVAMSFATRDLNILIFESIWKCSRNEKRNINR